MADRDVTVKDIDKNGILTYDEALIAAHDEYYNDGAIAGYATVDERSMANTSPNSGEMKVVHLVTGE